MYIYIEKIPEGNVQAYAGSEYTILMIREGLSRNKDVS